MPPPPERPTLLIKQTSGGGVSGSRRTTSFFNPELVTPAFTPGLTPSPRSQAARQAFGGRNPSWGVHPPGPAATALPPGQEEGAARPKFTLKSWLRGESGRKGPCAIAIAILLGAVLLFVALGAYVVLIYLAITTKRPKYIAFTSVLGILFVLIACNALSSSSGKPIMVAVGDGRERTKSEEHDDILRAFGLEPTRTPVPVPIPVPA